MESFTIFLLVLVIVSALIFEYINGFHDCANAIATVVSTRVLTARQAILFSASLNFIGALCGTHVAKTIGGGIIDSTTITLQVILCALLSAIVWDIVTWYLALPISSSHALIGGLVGASFVHAGGGSIQVMSLIDKVIIPMFLSPICGFAVGFVFMLILIRLFYKAAPHRINRRFRKYQLISSGFMALSHGTNDAQKTMGVISLSLVIAGVLPHVHGNDFEIPIYVIMACAFTMALGTMSGGWKIIRTMGSKIIKLKPIHGFAAETSSATLIMIASHFGIPLSTTHVISTAIMGVGSTIHASAVKWSIVKNIIITWFLTIPACIILSGIFYKVASLVF